MATSSVVLDTTQYVRINIAYKSMILQAHNDSVRVVVSQAKPAKSNTAFHTLGGGDAPLHIDIINDTVWALAMTDKSSLIITESTTSFSTEETVSQLVMAVTNALDFTAYDLNAAAFSETTNIVNDYNLISVEMNFTTTALRDIIITSHDGTILLDDKSNIDKNFVWADIHQSFKSGENITVDITQAGAACLADVILRVQSGTNSLLGNPDVRVVDSLGNVYEDVIQSHCMPTIEIDHLFTHAGTTFTCSDTDTVTTETTRYYLIKAPSCGDSHMIHYEFVSSLADADIILYESPTILDEGVQMTLRNRNRASSLTAHTEVWMEPTIDGVQYGTHLDHDLIIGGKQSGGGTFTEGGQEWILKQSLWYLIAYTNNANQDDKISHKFTFLEPCQL